MRYIKYCYENGYCGCEDEGVTAYEDNWTDDMIEQDLQSHLYDYGTSFEYCAEGCSFDDGWENEEDKEYYYENLMVEWEEITKEEYENWA